MNYAAQQVAHSFYGHTIVIYFATLPSSSIGFVIASEVAVCDPGASTPRLSCAVTLNEPGYGLYIEAQFSEAWVEDVARATALHYGRAVVVRNASASYAHDPAQHLRGGPVVYRVDAPSPLVGALQGDSVSYNAPGQASSSAGHAASLQASHHSPNGLLYAPEHGVWYVAPRSLVALQQATQYQPYLKSHHEVLVGWTGPSPGQGWQHGGDAWHWVQAERARGRIVMIYEPHQGAFDFASYPTLDVALAAMRGYPVGSTAVVFHPADHLRPGATHGMGLVPPMQDISHFRAPYKNAIFGALGATGGFGYAGPRQRAQGHAPRRAQTPWPIAGFGAPVTCLAPKWEYNDITGSCICAPGYVPTPDGRDCIPVTGTPINPEPAGSDAGEWLVDPNAGPMTAPAPAAACTGYTVSGHCVPKWAAWGGGALAALLVLDLVL